MAAREARRILDQIAAEDRGFADLTFQCSIYDRRTQTWGTVHYETGKPHVVIRLRNSHSERLRLSVERLTEHLIAGHEASSLTARALIARDAVIRAFRRVWFRQAGHRPAPINFDAVKVLEANSSTEALSGTVVPERTLGGVLRARRGDLKIASVFLFLGVVALLAASPLAFDFDRRVHDLDSHDWNGWLAWLAGNWSRLATSIFVVAFLPLVQLLLYWREVRRRPIVRWNID